MLILFIAYMCVCVCVFYLQLFVGELMSYLCYLCLFVCVEWF
jgi:hypothetical protein